MYLNELTEGTKLTVIVESGKRRLELIAEVRRILADLVLVAPIATEGKVIDFSSPKAKYSVIYAQENEKPILWSNCEIIFKYVEGVSYHIIACKRPGRAINRRRAFRVFMGYAGTVQLFHSKESINVSVKDLSVIGVAFITAKELDPADYANIELAFTDTDTSTLISIVANVVRKQTHPDNVRFIYGCKIVHSNTSLAPYVQAKQRAEAARRKDKL